MNMKNVEEDGEKAVKMIRKLKICECGHSAQVHYPLRGCILCSCKKYRPSYVQIVRDSHSRKEARK